VIKRPTIIGVLLVFLVACKPGTPSEYIQPDKMEDILVDYHMARAIGEEAMSNNGTEYYIQEVYIDAVLKKHGVTRAEFDSSLVYYYTRADRFEEIYKRVASRLEEQALVMGVSESEIGKYASLDATGDTANVWSDRPNLMMMPVPPYNRRSFQVLVDSTFQKGDSFLFQFMSDYLYQDGMRLCIGYVAFHYTDTVVARYTRIQTSGLNQLRIPGRDEDLTAINGYFFVGEGSERSSTTRMLFMNNIQFIRFHKEKKKEDEINQKDSLSSDSLARRLVTDTLSRGDSIRGGETLTPFERGRAEHRMVDRISEN